MVRIRSAIREHPDGGEVGPSHPFARSGGTLKKAFELLGAVILMFLAAAVATAAPPTLKTLLLRERDLPAVYMLMPGGRGPISKTDAAD